MTDLEQQTDIVEIGIEYDAYDEIERVMEENNVGINEAIQLMLLQDR